MRPSNPYSTYRRIQKLGRSARDLEARALIEAAHLLADARANPKDSQRLIHALDRNWRQWTIIQAALAGGDTQLPQDLQASLLQLGRFVDRQTGILMRTPDGEGIDALISINRLLAKGLIGSLQLDKQRYEVQRSAKLAAQAARAQGRS